MVNDQSGGILLDFANSPKSRPVLIPISCIATSSLATAVHKNCSYFIHRQLCFRLSKRIVTDKDATCDKNLCSFSFHLQTSKVLVCSGTEEIMPPAPFKQLSSFSQACHFVHQNMGHSISLWVYNCHCFQLSRPE